VSSARTRLRDVLRLAAALLLPAGLAAQTTIRVDGRVVQSDGAPIPGAVVELEGLRPTLSDGRGDFRFQDVQPGPRTIHIRAFGYESLSELVILQGDTTLTLTLQVAPFEFDSLRVDARRIPLEGEVRNGPADIPLIGVDVLTDQGGRAETDVGGRFRVEAWEGVPVRILVRAFGFLPLDTLVEAENDARLRLDLQEDSVVIRMLAVAEDRIMRRGRGRISLTLTPLRRDELLRWRGAPLDQVLQARFPASLQRLRCVVLDERALTPLAAEGVLGTTPAWQVDRMEFLFRGRMLRIYTRDFMRRMLGTGLPLRQPVFVESTDPPFCA
jgi:hypothetical protein